MSFPERADNNRAAELGVSSDQYAAWLAGKPSPEVESKMLKETDDLRRRQALSR